MCIAGMASSHHRHIEIVVTSPEEADYSVAEFWVAGEQLGWTHVEDGEVVLQIEPRPDGTPWHIAAHALYEALASARSRLAEPYA